jgi:DNA-binding Lrp family transcriptional regulator
MSVAACFSINSPHDGAKPNASAAPSKPQTDSAAQEVLAGLVERVTFHNAENGFSVLQVAARGHRDLVTVVGHAAVISAGEWITASGEWTNDRKYGQQFRSRFLRVSPPTSIEGIEKYLGSGIIRGIGPVYATKLVRAFGEKVFDTIEAEPERLREVPGIGPMRAKSITQAWAKQKVVREIMVFLHTHGVSTARAVRIYKTYGADALPVMSENPYRLARDIRGIGFKTADAIAMKLGIEKTAMIRVRAGISYALTEAMDEGHCGLPTDELIPLAESLLEVPAELVQAALDLELSERTVVADSVDETPCIFLAGLHRAERVIAERLLCIAGGAPPWPQIDPAKALPWVEQKIGIELADSQKEAIAAALGSKALVVTGGPGVGKTTIVRSILHILSTKGVEPLLCAPTGRAAMRPGARVVEHDVGRAETPIGLVEERGDRCRFGRIGGERDGADLGGERYEFGRIARREPYLHTECGEAAGHGSADTGARSDDKRRVVGKIAHMSSLAIGIWQRSALDRFRRLPEQNPARRIGHGGLRVDLLGERIGALHRRAGADCLEPALEIGKIRELLALPLMRHDPGIARHVGDRIGAGDERAIREPLVEDCIEAVCFLDVAFDRVGYFFGRVLAEMVVLARHWAEPAHMPEQPLQNLDATAEVSRNELRRLLREVEQDRAGLEDADRRTRLSRIVIDDGGNAVVWRKAQKVRLELVAGTDVHRHDLVRKPGFLEKDRDLVAVGRRPVVQVDHGSAPMWGTGDAPALEPALFR